MLTAFESVCQGMLNLEDIDYYPFIFLNKIQIKIIYETSILIMFEAKKQNYFSYTSLRFPSPTPPKNKIEYNCDLENVNVD